MGPTNLLETTTQQAATQRSSTRPPTQCEDLRPEGGRESTEAGSQEVEVRRGNEWRGESPGRGVARRVQAHGAWVWGLAWSLVPSLCESAMNAAALVGIGAVVCRYRRKDNNQDLFVQEHFI